MAIPSRRSPIRGGSVTAAADELVVTQPSVSSALAALSRELDCEVFECAGRGIRLTAAGAAFAPYAADVLGLLEPGPDRRGRSVGADGTQAG
jgi:DNA-binding transcriptional LysR family regulator